MCGICGIVLTDPAAAVSESALACMTSSLAHRGPDGGAVAALGPAGLGCRRLAIVDRTPAGAQPMVNAQRSLWIVFNGEIYNHRDERRHLESRGYRFQSCSDTEVLLYLYQEFGDRCLERLEGMFAFAVWDASARTLFVARDRFGKKPLYYEHTPDGFTFASEIKALLALKRETPAVDPEAIHHFLSFAYVPNPRTAFRGILKLPPAHLAVFAGGRLHIRRYFKPNFVARRPRPDPEAASTELRSVLETAVTRRLADDVPMGVFLSGGIDSSTIVALLTDLRGPVATYSMGFREKDYDERPYARLVAETFRTDHHEFVLEPNLATELPRILRQFDEPFGDPSALPTYLLAREARRSITVALTGDGGDEGFAGYGRYLKSALASRYLRVPPVLRRFAGGLVRSSVPGSLRFDHRLRRLVRFAAFPDATLADLYCNWLLHFDMEEKRELYTGDFAAALAEDSFGRLQALFNEVDAEDAIGRELATDVASYLPDDLLVKTDIATMAHGLEARCPFLDSDVMAFAAGLPSPFKLRGTRRKWILRRTFRDRLPSAIVNRRKQGFGLPLGRWLRRDLRPLVHEIVLGSRALARGYFRADSVRRIVSDHESRRRERPYHLWNLLALELWHLEVVDAARKGVP